MGAVKKLSLVEAELKNMTEGHCSLTAVLQLTQKNLEGVREEMREKNALIESIRGASKARRNGGGQERVLEKLTKRRVYRICVQECFSCFARVVDDQVLDNTKLETSEL